MIGGNCGFTLAPLKERDADYTRRMMAQVEGMPLAALEQGVPWTWESFGEFLDALDGNIARERRLHGRPLRAAPLRDGRATSRVREATADELAEIAQLLRRSLAAGGLGLLDQPSSTARRRRRATRAEPLGAPRTSCSRCARSSASTPARRSRRITQGCIGRFADDEVELLAQMSARPAARSTGTCSASTPSEPDKVERQLRPSARRARARRSRRRADACRCSPTMNMSFLTFCALWLIPGWRRRARASPVAENASAGCRTRRCAPT